MNFKQIIEAFIAGASEGTSAGQGNLRIKGNTIIHYSTPVLERYGEKYILNYTRYSIVTGRLQKQIKEMIPEDLIILVTGVQEGYKGSLADCIR